MTTIIAPNGKLDIITRGSVLIAKMDGGRNCVLGHELSQDIAALVDQVESASDIRAVVLTGKHPKRFVGHGDVQWLQEGGAASPAVGRGVASAVARAAAVVRRRPVLHPIASHTLLRGAIQLDQFHDMFVRMNASGIIYVAALNGSALGGASELSQACDVRLMADGDFFIGQPEVLLGFSPGGGGTQRLSRLVGTHRALMMMLEGKAVSPQKALEIGLIDELVPPDELIDRAVALGEYLGLRSRDAIASIKRTVYFGSSETLEEGLHMERTEFLRLLPSINAQSVMKEYNKRTETKGDLPLYDPDAYAAALKSGGFPKHDSANRK